MIDVARFVEDCEYDLCADTNTQIRNTFLCSSIAAYARECRLANININWLTNPTIQSVCQTAQYGQCTGGAAYSDCAPKCSQTCQQLTNANQTCYERECIAGCSCPGQTYLDVSNRDKPQCVPQHQCSCYDSESSSYVRAGDIVTKSCGNW